MRSRPAGRNRCCPWGSAVSAPVDVLAVMDQLIAAAESLIDSADSFADDAQPGVMAEAFERVVGEARAARAVTAILIADAQRYRWLRDRARSAFVGNLARQAAHCWDATVDEEAKRDTGPLS